MKSVRVLSLRPSCPQVYVPAFALVTLIRVYPIVLVCLSIRGTTFLLMSFSGMYTEINSLISDNFTLFLSRQVIGTFSLGSRICQSSGASSPMQFRRSIASVYMMVYRTISVIEILNNHMNNESLQYISHYVIPYNVYLNDKKPNMGEARTGTCH